MKADVQYNDFRGSAAADISDFLGSKYGDNLKSFGKYFKIDENRFEVVGLSVYGTERFSISLYCVDKVKSKPEKEHVVSIWIDIENDKEILNLLFKRLHVVLHSRFDKIYGNLDFDEEVNYEDYHQVDDE